MKLLVILFVLKLYACVNIFKHIQGKYEQGIMKIARKIEEQRVKIAYVQCDIKFILHCITV